MFEIGFSELLLIGVVALVVIGPERLPKVAKTFGHLMSRLQRYVNDVKADINREIELEELKKLQGQLQETADAAEKSISDTVEDLKSEIEPEKLGTIHNQSFDEEVKTIATTESSTNK